MKKPLVPCYPLASVLTASQLAAVRPFMRATFTETWNHIMWTPGVDSFAAQEAINDAQRTACGKVHFCVEQIEAALYARAVATYREPVMARPRGAR